MNLPSRERKPVYAPRGVVAASQPLAASTGLAVLRRGGNAVDAAVATAITLTVVQPGSNDIGGDLFAIVWDGSAPHGLNGSGRSPAALTHDLVPAGMPNRGWLPVTVPGAPAGWRDLHARFGRLPFAELFTDAIGYAEEGHPVAPTIAANWARSAATARESLGGKEYEAWAEVFAPGGRPPRAGEVWRNPGAARSLRLIAETDADAFYSGEIAAALAGLSAETGGLLTAEDLAAHTSLWSDPISAGYRGYQVWELPPNGQGLAALLALSILDGRDGRDRDGWPARFVHEEIEATKLAFADAHAVVADPEQAPAPVEELLDPSYVARRRALITDRAHDPRPGAPGKGGTVYLCAADADGMMVSLIQSTYMGFGSFVTLPGYGFGLQNRGAGFVTEPGHPNAVGPAKRPFHTIIPGFLTRDGEPVGPFGVMGGHMQPQGHLQLVAGTADGLDPQAALGAPRWYWDSGRTVLVEPELAGLVGALRRRGHDARVAQDRTVFGNGQAIWRQPGGGYVAGTDPRADGYAAAW